MTTYSELLDFLRENKKEAGRYTMVRSLLWKYYKLIDYYEKEGFDDDRGLVVNIFKSLIKACKEMEEKNIESPALRVTFYRLRQEEENTIVKIASRFGDYDKIDF